MSGTGMMHTFVRNSRRAFTTVAQSVSDASITWSALERQYVSYKLLLGIAGVTTGGAVYLSQWATQSQIVQAKADFQREINQINHGIGQINLTLAKLDMDMNHRFTKMETDIEQRFAKMDEKIARVEHNTSRPT